MQSKGLSRVFSNTTVQKHQFLSTQLYCPTLISIRDYEKNCGREMKTADLLEKPSVEEQMSCLSPVFLFIKGLKLEARQLTGGDPKGDGLEQTGMVYIYVKLLE